MQTDRQRTVSPLTPDKWEDIVQVFGGSGDGGCWCMWWRLGDDEYQAQVGEQNRIALKALVNSGKPPGVIAYIDGEPAGWCSIGPREQFERLEASSQFKRIDERPVWSIVCFYVKPRFRGLGLMDTLTRGAVALAWSQNAKIVESYPVEVVGGSVSHAYTGVASVLRSVGFVEVSRSGGRPTMRHYRRA
jgi:hypothetical protein